MGYAQPERHALPGATVTGRSGRLPKKSEVVCEGVVGSGPPARSRNWIPGYPPVLQAEPVLRSAKPSSPCPVAPCPPRYDSARPAARHCCDGPPTLAAPSLPAVDVVGGALVVAGAVVVLELVVVAVPALLAV